MVECNKNQVIQQQTPMQNSAATLLIGPTLSTGMITTSSGGPAMSTGMNTASSLSATVLAKQ